MRFLLPFLLVLLALPAAALDLTMPRVIISGTCTDDYNVPATTYGDLAAADFDTLGVETLDPDVNLGNSVQTSGSSDFWCDDQPWVISSTVFGVLANSRDYVIGPITLPRQGIYLISDADTIGTSYSFDLGLYLDNTFGSMWTGTNYDTWLSFTDSTTTNPEIRYYGPEGSNELSSELLTAMYAPLATGAYWVFRIDLNATGTIAWDFSFATIPAADHQSGAR